MAVLRMQRLRPQRSSKALQCVALGSAAVVAACLWSQVAFLAPPGAASAARGGATDSPYQVGQGAVLGVIGGMLSGMPAASAADVAGEFPVVPLVAVLALIAAAAAVVLAGDEKSAVVDDKSVVTQYFNTEGFERWQKIYGETDEVNVVQKDIRNGHAMTIEKILGWLDKSQIEGKTICDAGCGCGNLSIPLASRGAKVSGSDISSAMVGEAAKRAKDVLPAEQQPVFMASDLETLDGKYDTVCCVDVLIHYPPENLNRMVGHLASLSKDRLVLSFAPKTWYYTLLKKFGELFPGKSKATRAYLHSEEVVEEALRQAGFDVTRREMTATNFYFSRLFEAKPRTAA